MAQLESNMAQEALDAKAQQEKADERRKKRQQEIAREMAEAAQKAAQQKAVASLSHFSKSHKQFIEFIKT